MNLTVLLVLTATLVSCHGMPAAPSSLAISGVTSESFTAIFDSVSSATSYEVSYTAQHDSTNTGSVNIAANFTTVTGLASNLNYDVRVRAFLSDVAGNYSTTVRARTAPSGSSILQVITTPTYITVFLEETPGATKWEVEYSDGGSTSTIIVPDDVPSMTNYIAIISSLLPNTSYTLRARVSQINGDTNYNVAQSPYGSPTEITTDKVSAFGRVQWISRSYTSTDNTNIALKTEIATELLNAYQSVTSNVVDVSVVELENDGSGNILCHHEIVLNDQTSTPIISALTLSDSALYNGSSVRFDVGESFIVEKFEDGFDIQYADRTPCPGSLSPSRVWTLYDKNGSISSTELPNPDNNIVGVSTVTFADTGFTSSSTILLPFSQNTIYGIKQEYLIKTCPDGDDSTLYYNRVHGANGAFTNVEANKYTIINTTNVQSIGSITYTTAASGTEVTLNVPANLIQRAFQYNFDVAGLVTTLSQSDLDSSTTYLVSLTGLPQDADSEVTMEVRARGANSSNSNASRIVTVTTDTNECSVGLSNCDTNASCENFVGNFTCTCNIGYSGNGTSCSDIGECATNTDNCHTNATCTNTEGSYTCTCNDGYSGNGTACVDTDECTNMTDNCHENANCTNTDGSYTCTCNDGYTGNGTACNDTDECTNMIDNCHENATCTNTKGSYTCTCNDGYSGNGTACNDIDECINMIENCHENANCTNTKGSYTCTCNDGYTGNGTACNDFDECTNMTDNCHENATCINTDGSYTCTCNDGYTGNSTTCNDIDECINMTDNCHENANCTNTDGSYTCTCYHGYTGNGTTCSDIDECTDMTDNCHEYANCTNTEGSYTCTCNDGYTGNGTTCSDIDECNDMTDNCHKNATCTNTEGSYTCTCNDGLTGNGTTCSDIDECTNMTDNCHANATCFNTEGSFLCNCASGFSGSGTICTDIDECLDDILNICHENAACINLTGSLHCTCNRGFSGDGLICRDIDECAVFSHSCHESSNCSNTFGGFECYCGNRLLISSFNCLDDMDCNNYTCEERSLAWIAAIVVPVLAIILIVIIIIKCRQVKGAYDPKQVNKSTTLDMSTLQANEQNSQNTRSNVKRFYDLVDAQKQFDSNAGQYCTSAQGNDADVEANSRQTGSYDPVEAQRQFDLNGGRYKTCLEDFDADDEVTSPSSKKDSNDPEQINKNTASNVSGSYDLVEAQKQFDLNAGQYRTFQQGNDVDVVVDDVDVVVNSHRSQKGSYDLVEAQRQFDLNGGRYKTCLEDFHADDKVTSPSSKDTLDSGVENLAFDRADESLDSGMESEQSDESLRNSSRKGSYDVLEAQQRFNIGTKQQAKDSSIKQQTAVKPGSSHKNKGDETGSKRRGKGFYDLLKAQKEFDHGEGSSEYFSHPDQRSNTPHQREQAEDVVKKGSYDVLKAQQEFNLQISDSVERNFHPDDKEVAVNE